MSDAADLRRALELSQEFGINAHEPTSRYSTGGLIPREDAERIAFRIQNCSFPFLPEKPLEITSERIAVPTPPTLRQLRELKEQLGEEAFEQMMRDTMEQIRKLLPGGY